MDRPPDHYAVLGVAVDSDAETLRDAYRSKLRTTHPDTAESAADAAQFNDVVDAGDVLLDPARRKAYNEQVAQFWSEHTDRARTQRVEQAAASSSRFDPSFLVLAALLAIVGVAVWLWFPNRGTQSTASVSTSGNDVVAVESATSEPDPTEAPEAIDSVATDDDSDAAEPAAADTSGDEGQPDAEADVEADSSESMPRSERPTAVEVDEPDDATASTTDDATTADDDSAADTSGADNDDDGAATGILIPLDALPERGAIFRPPDLYLLGPVPDQETMDQVVEVATAVVGEENIVNEMVIHPDAPENYDGNVRVEQAVQFAPGSATILAEFETTLAVGYAVMLQNPQVTAVISGHTDDIGSDVANLALSERRAVAVVDWLVERGVDRNRLIPVGFGEEEPVASNDTPEGRASNRRIEAQFLDLLTPQE